MKILIVEQDDSIRADLSSRVEEASRRTSLKGISVVGNQLKDVGSFLPDLIFLGPFAFLELDDVVRRLQSMFPQVPLCLLLGSEEYVSEAIEIRRNYAIRILALGDIPQIAQVIIDVSHGGGDKRVIGQRGKIISVVHTKGGVGATSIAASISSCLSHHKLQTVLVDYSVVSPEISSWVNYDLSPQTALKKVHSSGSVIPGMIKELIKPASNNLKNLYVMGQLERYIDSFRYHVDSPESLDGSLHITEKLIEVFSQEFEFLVIDLSTSWGVSALAALSMSTHVLFVVENSTNCLQRSIDDLQRISAESEDPSEFDFRKWSFVSNGVKGGKNITSWLNLLEENSFLSTSVPLYNIPFSKKGADWISSDLTLYDLGEYSYQSAIDETLYSIFPTLHKE